METRGPSTVHVAFSAAGGPVITAPANTTLVLLPGETLAAPVMRVESPTEDRLAAPNATFVPSEEILRAPARALLDPLSPEHLLVAPDRAAFTWPVPVALLAATLSAPDEELVLAPAMAKPVVALVAAPAMPAAALAAAPSALPAALATAGEPGILRWAWWSPSPPAYAEEVARDTSRGL